MVVCAGEGRSRAGLTVSSIVIIDGEPGHAVVWIDPDTDLADRLIVGASLAITQLTHGDEYLADAFAGTVPAPGGPFTLGDWQSSDHGPVLVDRTWLGGTVTDCSDLGWSRQIVAEISHTEFTEQSNLSHSRGHYE